MVVGKDSEAESKGEVMPGLHECPHCHFKFENAEDLERHLNEGSGCPALSDHHPLVSEIQVSAEPIDELTALTDKMRDALLDGDVPEDLKGIVCLSSGGQGGIALFGYEDVHQGITDLVMHVQAMLQTEKMTLGVISEEDGAAISIDEYIAMVKQAQ